MPNLLGRETRGGGGEKETDGVGRELGFARTEHKDLKGGEGRQKSSLPPDFRGEKGSGQPPDTPMNESLKIPGGRGEWQSHESRGKRER